jgi:magnesium chelatase subunit I
MSTLQNNYPFAAIVGQEEMKKGLLLNAINPKLFGILIRGEKGTAKSTAVRALADLLPAIDVVADCLYGCNPDEITTMCISCQERLARGEVLPRTQRKTRVLDLPISATEDRVVGTLDIEQAIKKGEKMFEPGLLAQANRGILYVDEVNLLDDHIVDVLLDSAAMGINTVEREGVSFSHPANFILIGTMNPEEGELRPQLLDRFGLCVNITGINDPALRVEVVKRRAAFEENAAAFCNLWGEEQDRLRRRVVEAKELLPRVQIADQVLLMIASIAIEMEVDGHRADLTMMKAAKTMAAFNGRLEVAEEDIRLAVDIVLLHRMRRKPFQKMGVDQQKLQGVMDGFAHAHPHSHVHAHPHNHDHN